MAKQDSPDDKKTSKGKKIGTIAGIVILIIVLLGALSTCSGKDENKTPAKIEATKLTNEKKATPLNNLFVPRVAVAGRQDPITINEGTIMQWEVKGASREELAEWVKKNNDVVEKQGKVGGFEMEPCPTKTTEYYIQYSWTKDRGDGMFYEVYFFATKGGGLEIEIDPTATKRCS